MDQDKSNRYGRAVAGVLTTAFWIWIVCNSGAWIDRRVDHFVNALITGIDTPTTQIERTPICQPGP